MDLLARHPHMYMHMHMYVDMLLCKISSLAAALAVTTLTANFAPVNSSLARSCSVVFRRKIKPLDGSDRTDTHHALHAARSPPAVVGQARLGSVAAHRTTAQRPRLAQAAILCSQPAAGLAGLHILW